MSTNATYRAWIDKALNDLGPSVMETPIKVTLKTANPAQQDVMYNNPRSLFDAAIQGHVEMDEVQSIEVAGDTYVHSAGGWVCWKDTSDWNGMTAAFGQGNADDVRKAQQLQRARKVRDSRAKLVEALRECYTTDELGSLFDLVEPWVGGDNSAANDLLVLLGLAWTNSEDDEHPF
jgi:hypothetical protein